MRATALTRYLTYQLYHARLLLRRIGEDDPEPLHQFRITLRRVRALLKLFFPDAKLFPQPLKELVRETNALRELDVFFHSLDQHSHKHARKMLKSYRAKEYAKRFGEPVRSHFYTQIDALYDTLQDANLTTESADMIERAQNHYARNVHDYRVLSDEATPKERHKLRIRFKISRYALEFLDEAGLKNEAEIIAECKRLQGHLGELQDLVNQVEWLERFCEDHPHEEFDELLKERKKRLKKVIASSRSD